MRSKDHVPGKVQLRNLKKINPNIYFSFDVKKKNHEFVGLAFT